METSLKEKQDAARAALKELCENGPQALPAEEIVVTPIEDLVQRNGRHHKAVNARWNLSRRLTMTQLMILSFYREHELFLDADGRCFGFEGREKDYADYVREARVPYEKH
jgi:hypothetical protein